MFDFDACMVDLSDTCLSTTGAIKVKTSEDSFDSASAGACFGSITSCPDPNATTTDTWAHKQACANMLTSDRPVGAACNSSDECARSGDFSVCYQPGTGANNTGVCAQAVLDQTTCSFSFSTLELHMCPDGTYCDRTPATGTSTQPPSQQEYEYSASCKPYISSGGSCIDTMGNNLPCAAGLYCQVTGGKNATCTAYKTSGQTCMIGDQCAAGLTCQPGMNAMDTCQPDPNVQNGSYCYVPPKCGDGICQAGETMASCPTDCGCSTSCFDALNSNGTPCANNAAATSAYNSLKSCASGSCSTQCPTLDTGNFNCTNCLQTSCQSQYTNCQNN
jgi:hypothetical protein